MELESTTTIREKINWMEDQPIAWDKNQAWMRVERGGDKEEPVRRFGYYAAAAVVVLGIAMIMTGDYGRELVKGGSISEAVGTTESAKGISNIELRISNVEVGAITEVACVGPPLGVGGERGDRVPVLASTIVTPEVIEESQPLVLMPEPVEGRRIAIVENTKPVVAPVERVRAIFGVEEQPTVAMIRQGKKLRIYFLQNEVSQSQASVVNIDESSGLEARLNK